MSDVSIRRSTPEDVPAILNLVRTCLGESENAPPRTEAYWRWKHEANPFGASPVLVAEAEEGSNASKKKIVGARAFLRWQWQHGGGTGSAPASGNASANGNDPTVEAVRAVDTVTHAGWRGQGIFTRLTKRLVEEMRAEGVAFVFNTPNAQSRPGYLKMGWEALGRVSFWVRPLRPLRGARALLFSEAGVADERAPAWLADSFRTPGALFEEAGSERLQRLSARARNDARYATPRTEAYLRWRYAAVPGFEYRAAWTFDGEAGAALIFRGRVRQGLRELRLCEVLAGPGRRSVKIGRSLARHVARVADADYVVAMGARDTPARRILPGAGFVPLPRLGPHFTVRPLNSEYDAPSPLKRGRWRLAIGDLELF